MRKKVLLKTLATATMAITLSACTMEKADTNPSTQETEANISTIAEIVSEESSSEAESAVISTQEAESESGEESDTDTAALPEDERLLKLSANKSLSENDLREKAIATINEDPALPALDEKVPFEFFHYEDYDGDGTKEAFAGTSECVLFISSDGSVSNAKEIDDYYQYDDILPAPDGKFFLQYALGTGAENTYIALGVKNGKPYELKLSGYSGYGLISLQKDGSYTTYTGNYLETEPNIHEYPLSYKDGEFIPPAEFYFDYKGTVLKSYNGSDENVIIPKKCEDGTVFTEIDASTSDFFSLYWVGDEHPNFKSVEIPSTITKIGAASVGYFDGKKIDGFIIKCEKGSEAERYAKDNGFAVEYMK